MLPANEVQGLVPPGSPVVKHSDAPERMALPPHFIQGQFEAWVRGTPGILPEEHQGLSAQGVQEAAGAVKKKLLGE